METGMTRILVVDDEPDINMLLMLILEDSGYKVDVYDDPILALSNFKPNYYDLVILDIIMPTMNGFVFYQRIRELDTGVKACFLTASETSQQEFETRDISDRREGRAINPKADSKSRSTGKGKENSNEFQ